MRGGNPKWLSPILEWFHATMAGLVEHPEHQRAERGRSASYRVSRTTGLRLTQHAIDRYLARWSPGHRQDARIALLHAVAEAKPVGAPVPWARHGAEGWTSGRARFVVRGRYVVTVLPPSVEATPPVSADVETIRCVTCQGPAHPASGAEYAPGVVQCGPCVRETWAWVIRRVNTPPRPGKLNFFAHVNRIAEPVGDT